MTDSAIKAHRTVSRVTSILEYVAEEQHAPLNKIAAMLDAPKSSVFALVKGLVSTGYLLEEDTGYTLGPAVSTLLRFSGQTNLAEVAVPFLEELRDAFDETAMLATRVGDSLIYVATAQSHQPICYSAPLRVRRPLYPPSAGKVFLAWWTPKRREAYLRAALLDDQKVARAMAELEKVRVEHVAYNRGETLPDVSAVARPVLVRDEIVGAIAIAGPTSRMDTTLRHAPDALAEATRRLVQRLG